MKKKQTKIKKNTKVILYSGGYDSTLAAALFLEENKKNKVVLLILKPWFITKTKRPKFGKLLINKYGKDRVKIYIEKINILKMIFPKGFWYHATYSIPSGEWCAYCNVAMHISAVIFCLEHGYRKVGDGANKLQSYRIPVQAEEVSNLYRKFYSKYSIEYTNPVSSVRGTYKVLYKIGVLTKKEYENNYRMFHKGKLTIDKLFLRTWQNFFNEITGKYPQVQCQIVLYRNLYIQGNALLAKISAKLRGKSFNVIKAVKPELLLKEESEDKYQEALYPPIKMVEIEKKLKIGEKIIEEHFDKHYIAIQK